MKISSAVQHKIYTLDTIKKQLAVWHMLQKKVVFTNGVFDVLHHGHIASLTEAASHGDILIVAVNGDASVKRLKGPNRPINNENARVLLLANLLLVDAVIVFTDDTPLQLIQNILPDVLVKGGDYSIEQIAGAADVIAAGGKVILANMVNNVSSSIIINAMQQK